MSTKKKTITRLDSNYMQQYDAFIARKKRKKQRLIRRLVLFSLIALLVIGSMATYHVKQRLVHAEKKEAYEELQDEFTSLQKKEKAYKEEIDLLNDEEYVLEIARTNYFFSKKGEMIFKISDEDLSY